MIMPPLHPTKIISPPTPLKTSPKNYALPPCFEGIKVGGA